MSTSRRRFLSASAAIPLGLHITTHAFQAPQPRIGDTRDVFDAWFGPGTEADGFIAYPPLSAGRASYFVAYNEESRAEIIVGDFNNLEGGGIEFDWADAGQSQYLRDDATPDDLFQFVYFKTEGGYYTLRSWQSPELAAETGGSGYAAVLDHITAGMIEPTLFRETMVATETPEVNPIVPTGENLGPHSTMQEWITYNNDVSLMSEAGLVLDNPPLPGFWVIQDGEHIWAEVDPVISTQEAAELIGSMLPPSELIWSTWYGITPVTAWQIRLHQFRALDTGRVFLSAQFVDGDEETGTVSRFYLSNPRQ